MANQDYIDSELSALGLSAEQKKVFNDVIKGHNMFITGDGGTGKSFLIQTIKNNLSRIYAGPPTQNQSQLHELNELREAQGFVENEDGSRKFTMPPRKKRVSVTALTGCAAILLGKGAKTLHSWAGIGKGQGTYAELWQRAKCGKAYYNWLSTDVLIIDEVSMLTADLLDKLNKIAKKLRVNSAPFGGIQILLFGDFYQLPPIIKEEELKLQDNPTARFAFQADCWPEIINKIHILTQIYRQTDTVFQAILREIRRGLLSPKSEDNLRSRILDTWKERQIRPTLIYPRRAEVAMINENNLRALQPPKYTFKADIVFSDKFKNRHLNRQDPEFVRATLAMDSEAPYVSELVLAHNAQVMLIYNMNLQEGLCNGSRGVVVEFQEPGNIPVVQFSNGVKMPIGRVSWEYEDERFEGISRTQIPLRLAYACTIHKSQGASIDCALIDIGQSCFEYGQAYVALSRVRSLEGLWIHDFDTRSIRAHPDVVQFYEKLDSREIH
jgi:ATP-dependent DNA helicase PIF1